MTALDGLKDTVLPAIGHQLMDGAEHANAAYQAFRGINTANRREIHNSTSGLIPFMAKRRRAQNERLDGGAAHGDRRYGPHRASAYRGRGPVHYRRPGWCARAPPVVVWTLVLGCRLGASRRRIPPSCCVR
ncbi:MULTISPECIES: hypothetical protein [Mycolicibacter]|uniref:Uncharacterized protein n=2 Tax=Mycolicibacter TaxID=1073531 RepID=A0ABU5XLK2_9MYCO|nr:MULTISPECIES: hypothetical protein [unclassified Mycolicibacter]MEB3023079.1 hypothetical protein [Mycolicibacter sp. MYC098]MEB3033589.1 hypothetical protein [Mycolicibacter sp. MYC340]